MAGESIGAVLAKFANDRAKISFELQFGNIQKTLVNRFNKDVDKIEGKSGNSREVERLQGEAAKLSDSLPALEAYREGLLSSASVLEAIQAEVVKLDSTLDSNGDNNVDAAEVAAYTTLRDEIVGYLNNNLFIFVHPDINDGNTVGRLKEQADILAGQTPVVGALTDAANVAVTDYNATINGKVDAALASTIITISTSLGLEQKIAADFTTRNSKAIDLAVSEKVEDDKELDSLRTDLANFLRAISLSFEVNANFADAITSSLTAQRPEPGSVLNLFT